MHCQSCSSSDQAAFNVEMLMHFPGLKNIDNPGVVLIREVTVCLGCGHSRFTTTQTELKLLVEYR
jgi:hypothetical protein